MTTGTNEYPLRTLDEMRAAREKGDEICFDDRPLRVGQGSILVDTDDLNALNESGWTARTRKPKEFDFWEAMRAVIEGRAKKAKRVGTLAFCYLHGQALMWNAAEPVEICILNTETKWALYGNDGKPVYE